MKSCMFILIYYIIRWYKCTEQTTNSDMFTSYALHITSEQVYCEEGLHVHRIYRKIWRTAEFHGLPILWLSPSAQLPDALRLQRILRVRRRLQSIRIRKLRFAPLFYTFRFDETSLKRRSRKSLRDYLYIHMDIVLRVNLVMAVLIMDTRKNQWK